MLRNKASKVMKIDRRTQALLDDLTETLKSAGGLGLAAPQVGISQRLFVVRNGSDYVKLINPAIVKSEGEQVSFEACLSLPGVYGKVKRPAKVVVRALSEYGKPFELEGQGQLACALCHETDHLDGILFTDRAYQVRRLATAKRPDVRHPAEQNGAGV